MIIKLENNNDQITIDVNCGDEIDKLYEFFKKILIHLPLINL